MTCTSTRLKFLRNRRVLMGETVPHAIDLSMSLLPLFEADVSYLWSVTPHILLEHHLFSQLFLYL